MKKKVFCALVLVVYLLTCATLLATKIEDEMKPLVKTAQRVYNRKLAASLHMTDKALFQDEEGAHLFEVREGTAWETGLRAYEVPGWTYGNKDVSFYGKRNYTLVEAASRQPKEGELVKIVDAFQQTDDLYLYLFEHAIPKELQLPENATLLGQTEQSLLLSVQGVDAPFMAQTARGLSDGTRQASEVYSLKDMEWLFETLPLVITIPVLLVFGIIVWGVSCILSRNLKRNKLLLWINAALGAVLMLCFVLLLQRIDLPASLLPEQNILDMQHWQVTLDTLFDALRPFSAEAIQMEKLYTSALQTSHAVLQTGCYAGLGFIVMEWLLSRLCTKSRLLSSKKSSEIPLGK